MFTYHENNIQESYVYFRLFENVDKFAHWIFLSLKQEVACFVYKICVASWLSEENFYINGIACQIHSLALLFTQHNVWVITHGSSCARYVCIFVSNINIFSMSIHDNTLISSMLTNYLGRLGFEEFIVLHSKALLA